MEESETPDEGQPQQFEDMLDTDRGYALPVRGALLEGTIVRASLEEILVDIGIKREAALLPQEARRMPVEELSRLTPGKPVSVVVVNPRDQDGNVVVSIERARFEHDWRLADTFMKTGDPWEGTVVGSNKGGLVVQFGQIQGFVPASHLTGLPRFLPAEEKAQRLRAMLHKTLQLKVIEVDRARRRLVLSERLARKAAQADAKAQLMGQLRLGDVLRGTVRSVQPFGVFVDIGGADGLMHVSEISWSRVEDPRQYLRVGDQVDVQVIRLDTEHQRIGLSTKRLQPEPWTRTEQMFVPGQVVRGVVTRLAAFGAFVEVAPGIEGLVHVSELSREPVQNPRDVVSPGQAVAVRILRIEPIQHRMALSIAEVDPEEALRIIGEAEAEVGPEPPAAASAEGVAAEPQVGGEEEAAPTRPGVDVATSEQNADQLAPDKQPETGETPLDSRGAVDSGEPPDRGSED